MIKGTVTGLNELRAKLRALQSKYGGNPTVTVGYTQNYALYVHERKAKHKEGKQWKYLEEPARKLQGELAKIVEAAMKRRATLKQSLLVAGLRLQRESQKIVPIDTGALRASAFTAYIEDEEKAAQEAFKRSETERSRKK